MKTTTKQRLSGLLCLLMFLAYGQASAQVTWTSRTSAADNSWRSVAYGNGVFVAVAQTGTGNRVMTSPDGITWTIRTSAADNNWNAVTYGNDLFVAVAGTGTGNRVMTSPDGITWTIRTSAADKSWSTVTYGNGLFVAVANSTTGNRVMTSPDGITWTLRTSPADYNWLAVTYGNGLFVAVATSGTGDRVMTSPDGITWTLRTSAADNGWRGVTYGNGLFVAVSFDGAGNRVMTSPDGITWTIRTSAANNNWFGITYGNGLFVAVASTGTGDRVMTSPDGINWTAQTSAADNTWIGITYANGIFVAVGQSGTGNRVMTSGTFSTTLQYRTTGNVTFASATNWETQFAINDNWSPAAFAPNATANTLAITIRNGHTATVGADITLDQLTVAGTLQVSNSVTLTIADDTGTDLTVQNGGTLYIQSVTALGILQGAGSFTLEAGGTFITSNIDGFNAIGLTGIETFTAGANYMFDGPALQTINNPTGISANNISVANSTGVTLSNDITITGTLTLNFGDLDLNGKNITLNGTLVEDRANNHIVLDNTATSEANQGGGIIFTGTVTNVSTDIAGIGLHLQRTAGSDYAVTITRRHYRGAGASATGKGIKRIYRVTGSPTGTNTTMRIYYATDELADVSGTLVLFRWQSATGWKQATDASSDFMNGTNSVGVYVEATGINGFSDWTIGSSTSPLPITLLGLKGERVEGLRGEKTEEVRLDWATASEINNKGFEVEMSDNGLAYQKIAFVEGKGNSTTVSSYQLAVINASDAYYRLKQIDFDGKFSYSPVVFVEGLVGKVQIYPNPNNGTFTVSVGKDKLDLPARLLNAVGKEVWRGVTTKVATTGLPAGVYFLHTTVAGKAKVTKIVIQ
jgi:predicted RecA/RadA family phage recombinase